MATRLQLRRDTATNWTTANPILLDGEMAVETDTGKFKVGDGTTAWTSLAYSSGIQGVSGADGATWISGAADPTTEGVDGDFYLNTVSYDVFKKAAGSWGTELLNIKGSTGAAGEGVPTGGTTGQMLSKIDATNYNTEWIDVPFINESFRAGTHSGLNFYYKAGIVRNDNVVTKVAASSILLVDTSTNYIEVSGAGVVAANQVGYTSGKIPLFKATTSGGEITEVVDDRSFFSVATGGGGDIPAGTGRVDNYDTTTESSGTYTTYAQVLMTKDEFWCTGIYHKVQTAKTDSTLNIREFDGEIIETINNVSIGTTLTFIEFSSPILLPKGKQIIFEFTHSSAMKLQRTSTTTYNGTLWQGVEMRVSSWNGVSYKEQLAFGMVEYETVA